MLLHVNIKYLHKSIQNSQLSTTATYSRGRSVSKPEGSQWNSLVTQEVPADACGINSVVILVVVWFGIKPTFYGDQSKHL